MSLSVKKIKISLWQTHWILIIGFILYCQNYRLAKLGVYPHSVCDSILLILLQLTDAVCPFKGCCSKALGQLHLPKEHDFKPLSQHCVNVGVSTLIYFSDYIFNFKTVLPNNM
jgi:hypothetical protein